MRSAVVALVALLSLAGCSTPTTTVTLHSETKARAGIAAPILVTHSHGEAGL